ncbi:MAG: extracellular solute-binding protein [Clostridia bacterium]|nr:extracellular solute-binding protein [Clostridia bacterium]
MKEYEKMTGVHIEWENVDPSVFSNTLAAAIASDTLPDIIFKGNVTNELLYAWGDEGILVDLAPYLKDYAPNFYKLMKENPSIEQSITAPNGAIYGLPQVVIAAAMRVPDKMYINTKALAASGCELPKTLDDVYEMLLAMRDADFNGNGELDEVPLMSNTDWLYRYFLGSFGLRTRGAHHQTVDADPVTGEIRVFAQSENYRKFLEYLHKLYDEKLLYQEIFTEGKKNEAAYSANDRLGVIMDTTLNAVPTDKMPDWIGLTWQPEGPDGFALASEIRSNLHSEGNFCITDACQQIELAVSWIDYFYSEEGSLFYHAGIKDVNWEEKEDGSRYYTDATLATRTSDMTADSFLGQFAMWPGGRNPSVMLDNLWGAEYEDLPSSTAAALIHYASDIIWPIISWTPEENEVIKTVQADIQSFIAASTAQAIAGEIEITDAWWNEFVARIDTMGADKLIAAYESALNRIYGETDAK